MDYENNSIYQHYVDKYSLNKFYNKFNDSDYKVISNILINFYDNNKITNYYYPDYPDPILFLNPFNYRISSSYISDLIEISNVAIDKHDNLFHSELGTIQNKIYKIFEKYFYVMNNYIDNLVEIYSKIIEETKISLNKHYFSLLEKCVQYLLYVGIYYKKDKNPYNSFRREFIYIIEKLDYIYLLYNKHDNKFDTKMNNDKKYILMIKSFWKYMYFLIIYRSKKLDKNQILFKLVDDFCSNKIFPYSKNINFDKTNLCDENDYMKYLDLHYYLTLFFQKKYLVDAPVNDIIVILKKCKDISSIYNLIEKLIYIGYKNLIDNKTCFYNEKYVNYEISKNFSNKVELIYLLRDYIQRELQNKNPNLKKNLIVIFRKFFDKKYNYFDYYIKYKFGLYKNKKIEYFIEFLVDPEKYNELDKEIKRVYEKNVLYIIYLDIMDLGKRKIKKFSLYLWNILLKYTNYFNNIIILYKLFGIITTFYYLSGFKINFKNLKFKEFLSFFGTVEEISYRAPIKKNKNIERYLALENIEKENYIQERVITNGIDSSIYLFNKLFNVINSYKNGKLTNEDDFVSNFNLFLPSIKIQYITKYNNLEDFAINYNLDIYYQYINILDIIIVNNYLEIGDIIPWIIQYYKGEIDNNLENVIFEIICVEKNNIKSYYLLNNINIFYIYILLGYKTIKSKVVNVNDINYLYYFFDQ